LKKEENFRYCLSLGDRKDDKKYYKDDKAWDFAENVLRKVLKERNAPFFEGEGEAAFYGPKIDIQMKNFAGKEDTAFTVQYDFVMPKRFEMTYIDEKGKKQEPIVIHRSSIGAIERVMAFLIEHYAGAFPFWLAPEQVWVLPIGSRHEEYAFKLAEELKRQNIRVVVKNENETVGKKIREGEMQKIPYLLIVGDKEIKTKSAALRIRGKGDVGMKKLTQILKILEEEKEPKIRKNPS
jgi:threonyl-tRNA synthetase